MATTSEAESKATPENERQMEKGTGQELPVGGPGAAIGDEDATAIFYKTKVVEFLGRSTPIVLQNDNGPCPLLAICNVLLLRNVVELSLDVSEVSQQKLLSLVAERLLDSNSNLEGKDEGYISNQQRNISDAIDLLPRLASGIDVNVLFRKIDDFEFTRECAIFDLLDIGLYHGWIVDPQDVEAATAIGSKSYNALVGELVALDMKSLKEENSLPDEESVDFAAATTAALGVPSPSLSISLSLNDPQFSSSGDYIGGRGDLEETEELMRVLNLSQGERLISTAESFAPDTNLNSGTANLRENVIPNVSSGIVSDEPKEAQLVTSVTESNTHESPVSEDNITCLSSAKVVELSIDHSSPNHVPESLVNCSKEDESMSQNCMPEESTARVLESVSNDGDDGPEPLTCQDSPVTDLNSLSGRQDANESLSLNPNDVEPLYEGEECILDSAIYDYKNREPVYEGEAVLAMYTEQDDGFTSACSKDTASEHQWHLIKNFLKDNASQLTIYGLFCLQEGLKERELCVFFRNNHFSTMFKYKGELYLLATDQGYINQQNLVWEKLNEVNGDTMFVRSDFQPFMPEDEANHSWNEKNGTNDFLAVEGSTSANSTFKSDHELAKELQKQEFEKQPQRQQAPKVHQSSGPGSSRLIVGPQSSRPASNTSQKPDSKSKEKCVVM